MRRRSGRAGSLVRHDRLAHRLRGATLLWWLAGQALACAPAIPRTPDAAVDPPPAPDSAAEAHPQDRPAPPAVIDAGADDRAAARDATLREAPPDARVDARADGASDSPVDHPAATDAVGDDGPPPVSPRPGEVVIDELLVNPAGTDTNREWIEILNTTALALDLRLLHVADGASEVAVDAGVLPAGAILVLGQSADPGKNGGAAVDLSFGGAISLNNGGDSITLCLGSCAGGQILDQVRWDGDLGAAYDGHAVIVDPRTGAFCPADQPFGTAASFGSPGAANPACGD